MTTATQQAAALHAAARLLTEVDLPVPPFITVSDARVHLAWYLHIDITSPEGQRNAADEVFRAFDVAWTRNDREPSLRTFDAVYAVGIRLTVTHTIRDEPRPGFMEETAALVAATPAEPVRS